MSSTLSSKRLLVSQVRISQSVTNNPPQFFRFQNTCLYLQEHLPNLPRTLLHLQSSLNPLPDNTDLTNQLSSIFESIDEDGSGGLNYAEFKAKVREMRTETPIDLHKDDFDLITQGGELLNEEGEFDGQQFQLMMRGVCACACV